MATFLNSAGSVSGWWLLDALSGGAGCLAMIKFFTNGLLSVILATVI